MLVITGIEIATKEGNIHFRLLYPRVIVEPIIRPKTAFLEKVKIVQKIIKKIKNKDTNFLNKYFLFSKNKTIEKGKITLSHVPV